MTSRLPHERCRHFELCGRMKKVMARFELASYSIRDYLLYSKGATSPDFTVGRGLEPRPFGLQPSALPVELTNHN